MYLFNRASTQNEGKIFNCFDSLLSWFLFWKECSFKGCSTKSDAVWISVVSRALVNCGSRENGHTCVECAVNVAMQSLPNSLQVIETLPPTEVFSSAWRLAQMPSPLYPCDLIPVYTGSGSFGPRSPRGLPTLPNRAGISLSLKPVGANKNPSLYFSASPLTERCTLGTLELEWQSTSGGDSRESAGSMVLMSPK